MCLEISLFVTAEDSKNIKPIPRNIGKLALNVGFRWPWSRNVKLTISQDGTCACNMLTEEADWNNETWDIQPVLLEPLSILIKDIANKTQNGFSFKAIWASDKSRNTIKISLDDFIQVILSNKISTFETYKVFK